MPEQSRSSIKKHIRIVSIATIIFLLLSISFYLRSSSSSVPAKDVSSITHILLVAFKPTAKPKSIQRVSKQFIDLKNTCLHPRTQKPYILASKGGINNSPEGKGFTHGFILEFKDEADRQYFLDTDPAHKDFVSAIIPENGDFLTLDFTEGVYGYES